VDCGTGPGKGGGDVLDSVREVGSVGQGELGNNVGQG
jgi:hypothetical protein